MLRIRFIGLALVAAFALSAVAASAASASNFKVKSGGTYPVTIKGHGLNDQGFHIEEATSVCTEVTAKGELKAESNEETVHPEYKNCKVIAGGTKATATVTTTGCNYVFFDTAVTEKANSVNISCESGKEIVVHLEGTLACEIKIPPQTGLKTTTYKNEANGDVVVSANVTGIKSHTNCAIIKVKEGSNGEYREGAFSGTLEEPILTANAAKAEAEGFNSLGEKEAIEA